MLLAQPPKPCRVEFVPAAQALPGSQRLSLKKVLCASVLLWILTVHEWVPMQAKISQNHPGAVQVRGSNAALSGRPGAGAMLVWVTTVLLLLEKEPMPLPAPQPIPPIQSPPQPSQLPPADTPPSETPPHPTWVPEPPVVDPPAGPGDMPITDPLPSGPGPIPVTDPPPSYH